GRQRRPGRVGIQRHVAALARLPLRGLGDAVGRSRGLAVATTGWLAVPAGAALAVAVAVPRRPLSGLAFGSAVAGGSCRSLVAGTTARLPRLVGPPSGRVPYLVELRLRRGRRGLWRRGAEIGAGQGHRRRVRGCR